MAVRRRRTFVFASCQTRNQMTKLCPTHKERFINATEKRKHFAIKSSFGAFFYNKGFLFSRKQTYVMWS